ncbi:chemotaxis protein [Bacillus pumilus]|uniref:methyl-accepting chemotaxis protein n=1 Tax=Bacillus pumilus TaxID=1408 RepID=UPI00017A5D9B|nr:methyl-accepting chemotaxis protein [Bacillus pumilus]EDW22815.1 putative chemotaxis sensory transducer [Bacillus pumilus ATCC 7061]MCR4354510.1 methyl-accepting chemotaxis protein [Bacillus pumilus]MCY7506870.1 methyl-accepting chemotaxis protein [Bacillus pumilus]MDR4270664.1 chemotaxis protein [Bacillus pumilus]MED4630768.1 methyl-accepting chemotaxis protein [Bacillus pumilus]
MDILQSIVTAAPYIMQILKNEVTLGVTDREKFLLYLPSKDLDFQIRAGEFIKPDDLNLKKALRGEISNISLPESVYGTPLNSMCMPILDENQQAIGALALGFPLKNQLELEAYMESLSDIIQSIQEKVHVVAAHSEELSATSEEMTLQTQQTLESSKKTSDITKMIKGISKQTSLLGLNASIEAARAGKEGAGFSVVANEVQKLSSETSRATENIENSLQGISSNIHTLLESMDHMKGSSSEQALLVTEFSEIVDRLTTVSKDMKKFMQTVMST